MEDRSDLYALQRISVPDFNSIVPEPGDDFLIVILKAVHPFGVFTPAVYSRQFVLTHAPIVVYAIDIFDDFRKQTSVVAVIWMTLSWFWFEKYSHPEIHKLNQSN